MIRNTRFLLPYILFLAISSLWQPFYVVDYFYTFRKLCTSLLNFEESSIITTAWSFSAPSQWHYLFHFRWNLQFIKSEFSGQLPKQYEKKPFATKVTPSHMNDENLEEPTRYVSDHLHSTQRLKLKKIFGGVHNPN